MKDFANEFCDTARKHLPQIFRFDSIKCSVTHIAPMQMCTPGKSVTFIFKISRAQLKTHSMIIYVYI